MWGLGSGLIDDAGAGQATTGRGDAAILPLTRFSTDLKLVVEDKRLKIDPACSFLVFIPGWCRGP